MKGSRHCQCWSGSSLGLSKLSSLSAAGKGRWLHLGGILPTKGQAGLPAWRWQLKVSWLRHNLSPPEHSSLNASALQFALENLFSNVKSSPSCYRVSQIFSPIFAHDPLPPCRWGGGVPFSFPKNTISSPLCVFFEKSQLKYKHFSHFFSIFWP